MSTIPVGPGPRRSTQQDFPNFVEDRTPSPSKRPSKRTQITESKGLMRQPSDVSRRTPSVYPSRLQSRHARTRRHDEEKDDGTESDWDSQDEDDQHSDSGYSSHTEADDDLAPDTDRRGRSTIPPRFPPPPPRGSGRRGQSPSQNHNPPRYPPPPGSGSGRRGRSPFEGSSPSMSLIASLVGAVVGGVAGGLATKNEKRVQTSRTYNNAGQVMHSNPPGIVYSNVVEVGRVKNHRKRNVALGALLGGIGAKLVEEKLSKRRIFDIGDGGDPSHRKRHGGYPPDEPDDQWEGAPRRLTN